MRERGNFTRKIRPRHKTVDIRSSVGTRDLNRRQEKKRNLIFGSTHILVKAARRQTNKKKTKKTKKKQKKNGKKIIIENCCHLASKDKIHFYFCINYVHLNPD